MAICGTAKWYPMEREQVVPYDRDLTGAVKRVGRGRPKLRPRRLIGDKGYSSRKIRHFLHTHGIRITIPRRRNENRSGPFDRELYRSRNRGERLINRLK